MSKSILVWTLAPLRNSNSNWAKWATCPIRYNLITELKYLNTDGGAIKVHVHSVIHMTSVQFVNNTAGSGGGAVMVLDHSELQDTGSIYMQNLARGFGKYGSNFVALH